MTGRRFSLLLGGAGTAAAALTAGLFLLGGGASTRGIPTFKVERGIFVRRAEAEGYLRAVKATPISVPSDIPRGQHLAWVAPDGSLVKKGEVVARLDTLVLESELADGGSELEQSQLRAVEAEESGEKDRKNLALDAALSEQEEKQAEEFAPRDPAIFSRREILDSEIDLGLARDRIENNRSKSDVALRRSRNQRELLRIDRSQAEWKLRKARRGLAAAEIRAPHGGLLVLTRDWGGNPPLVGNQVWPGQKLAELPDPERLEAVAYVLEADATGLKPGCRARLTVEAHPEKTYPATVRTVNPLAKRKLWNVPIQYFEVTLSPDDGTLSGMKPGLRMQAEIVLQERTGALMIPPEAVFPEEAGEVAFKKEGDAFVPVPVRVGDRGLARVVVTGGLKEGDEVALKDPRWSARRRTAEKAAPPSPSPGIRP